MIETLCIFPNISISSFCPTFARLGLTMPKARDLFSLKPNSPPVALPTTEPLF